MEGADINATNSLTHFDEEVGVMSFKGPLEFEFTDHKIIAERRHMRIWDLNFAVVPLTAKPNISNALLKSKHLEGEGDILGLSAVEASQLFYLSNFVTNLIYRLHINDRRAL